MQEKYEKRCSKCDCVKPPRAHHCSTCKRCVMGMDHHCPWMNNCIGIRNHKSFILFCGYTGLSAFYAAVRGIIEFCLCLRDEDYECNTFTNNYSQSFAIGAIIVCGLFAMFTLTMFADQIHMKMQDTSTIDSMKAPKVRSELQIQREDMGLVEALGGWTALWWIPIPQNNDFSVELQLSRSD
jgi:palmitoyltransferase